MITNLEMSIGTITDKIDFRNFTVEDIFSNNMSNLKLRGKQGMVFTSILKLGDIVCILYRSSDQNTCELVTMTTVKLKNNSAFSKSYKEIKLKLDSIDPSLRYRII